MRNCNLLIPSKVSMKEIKKKLLCLYCEIFPYVSHYCVLVKRNIQERSQQNNASDSKVTCKLYHEFKKFNEIYN